MLAVLEAIAAQQPVGASALARHMGEDKSAVQRSLVTLSKAGWIVPTPDRPVRWELGARLFTLAHLPSSSEDLRRRARKSLEAIRDEIGETTFLAVPDARSFVIIDVAESPHLLRSVPRIGEVISPSHTATSKIMFAYLDEARRHSLLGREPTGEEREEFSASADRGYGLSVGEFMAGSTVIAAPIFDTRGQPNAAIAISGPSDRLPADRHDAIGHALILEASRLSRGKPSRQHYDASRLEPAG